MNACIHVLREYARIHAYVHVNKPLPLEHGPCSLTAWLPLRRPQWSGRARGFGLWHTGLQRVGSWCSINLCIYLPMYMSTYLPVSKHINIHAHMNGFIYTYIQLHIYIHIYIYIHIHSCIQIYIKRHTRSHLYLTGLPGWYEPCRHALCWALKVLLRARAFRVLVQSHP